MKHSLLLTLLLTICLPLAAKAADNYTIDPEHSFPHFSVNHLGFSTLQGRFDKASGKATLDIAGKKGSVELNVEAASVNTGFAKRDTHLRTPDFFNAAEFPLVTFKSTSFKFNGDKPESIEGNLTLLGVTKPVKLTVISFNCGLDPMDPLKRREKCGADVSAQIKRTDFGMKFGVPMVGDDIKLVFEIEAIKD
jgi:polyisoprenoid-binding protein YceI